MDDVDAPHQVTWHTNRALWQPITNARAIPDRRRQHELATPIPVRVRLIWQWDGTELLDTIAVGWAGELVHVQVRDVRVRIGFAWLHGEHVVRR